MYFREVEDNSDNSSAASRLYKLQNDLQQKQRQQLFEGMQHLLASLNAMPLLSQNLPFLPPPIPQIAAGEMENSLVFLHDTF